MLADIVAIQHDHLEALAHDWLAAGATAFCIWNPQDELLARWPLLANGTVKPIIDQTFPLTEAAAAHALMESNRHIGKILLQIA